MQYEPAQKLDVKRPLFQGPFCRFAGERKSAGEGFIKRHRKRPLIGPSFAA